MGGRDRGDVTTGPWPSPAGPTPRRPAVGGGFLLQRRGPAGLGRDRPAIGQVAFIASGEVAGILRPVIKRQVSFASDKEAGILCRW